MPIRTHNHTICMITKRHKNVYKTNYKVIVNLKQILYTLIIKKKAVTAQVSIILDDTENNLFPKCQLESF